MYAGKFFVYAEVHEDSMWLHWNMKNNTFGFASLEERFEQLGGTPFHFNRNTHNILHILKKKNGENFAGNTKWNGEVAGKMYDTFELNNINDFEILNGNQEIELNIRGIIECIHDNAVTAFLFSVFWNRYKSNM